MVNKFTQQDVLAYSFGQQLCSMWKNGIHWVNVDGIETVVEFVNFNQAVLLLSSHPKGMEIEHCLHRSALIKEIWELQLELCPSLELPEFLILPADIEQHSRCPTEEEVSKLCFLIVPLWPSRMKGFFSITDVEIMSMHVKKSKLGCWCVSRAVALQSNL